jgi:hypothetical protein
MQLGPPYLHVLAVFCASKATYKSGGKVHTWVKCEVWRFRRRARCVWVVQSCRWSPLSTRNKLNQLSPTDDMKTSQPRVCAGTLNAFSPSLERTCVPAFGSDLKATTTSSVTARIFVELIFPLLFWRYRAGRTTETLSLQYYYYNSIATILSLQYYHYNSIATILLLQYYRYNTITTIVSLQYYHYNTITTIPSLEYYHYNTITTILLLQYYHYNTITTVLSLQYYHYNSITRVLSLQYYRYNTITTMLSLQ